MDTLRSLVERLAFGLLRLSATAMTLAGVALVAPVLALAAFDAAATEAVSGGTLLLAATFAIAGLFCLVVARRRGAWLPDGANDSASRGSGFDGWLILFPLTLVGAPVFMALMLGPLMNFWRDVFALAERLGFWQETQRGGPGAGLVLMPVFAALAVPGIETLAALACLLGSVLLFALLATRSTRVPRALLLCVGLQGALVLAGVFGTGTIERLASSIEQLIRDTPDPGGAEQARAAQELERYRAVVRRASGTMLVTWGATAIWLPLLLLHPFARSTFASTEGGRRASATASAGGATLDPAQLSELDEQARARAYVKAARDVDRSARPSGWF